MKSHPKLHMIAIVCMFALAACNGLAAAPTATPKPSSTPAPTDTPQPTSTPTPTAQPTLALGERQRVNAGGYSFQAPTDFETEIRNIQGSIRNQDTSILIIIDITPRYTDAETDETVLTSFIKNIKTNTIKDLNTGDPYPAKVGNLTALAVNVSGTVFKSQSTGQIIVADTGQAGFFAALAFAADGMGKKRWETEGHQIFDAIMNSVEFFTPVVETGSCTIATDATYGYTQENPIKVGGDAFDGPPREREYLDNLAGPKGEKISYSQPHSLSSGDTILDVFVITGLSKEVTLYIDEYSFTEPQTPVGFTCLTAFSLEKP